MTKDITTNRKVRLALYCRVSTSKQDFAHQKDALSFYTKTIPGAVVGKEYTDKIGGRTSASDRDYAEDVIKDARDDEFDILVVVAVDRIARDEEYGLNYLRRIEETGKKVHFVDEPWCNTPDPYTEQAADHVKDARVDALKAARHEHRRITARNQNNKRRWMMSNKWPIPNDPPFGYTCDSKKTVAQGETPTYQLKIFEKEARVVRIIFDMYNRKNLSSRKIAKILNEDGVPAPEGGKWGKDTVIYIIGKEIYTGKTELGKKLGKYTFVCDPIITRDDYDLAKQKKEERFTLSPRNLKNEYLFRGLMRCAECRFHLFPRMQNGRPAYKGVSDVDNVKRCKPRCKQISERKVAVALVEHFVGTILFAKEKDIDTWFKNKNSDDIELKIELARAKIETIEEERGRADYLFEKGRKTQQQYDGMMNDLDKEEEGWLDKLNEHQQGLLTIEQKDIEKKRALEFIKGLRKNSTFLKTISPEEVNKINPAQAADAEVVKKEHFLRTSKNDFAKNSFSKVMPYDMVVKFAKAIVAMNIYHAIYFDKKNQNLRIFTSFNSNNNGNKTDPSKGDTMRLRLDDVYRKSVR